MRAAITHGDHDVRVADVPDPMLVERTDAVVRVVLSRICGSDLWGYRATYPIPEPRRVGHEFGDDCLPALRTLSDVMGTGHHAAMSAGVQPGEAVAIIGDGAVGLCAVSDGYKAMDQRSAIKVLVDAR